MRNKDIIYAINFKDQLFLLRRSDQINISYNVIA